jgi:predicted nucleotidyltransferase
MVCVPAATVADVARVMADVVDLPANVRAALGDFCSRMRARFGNRLEETRLFGSYARGDHTVDSDVDVLVVVRDLSERERREVFETGYEVYLDRVVELSPLALSSAEWRDRNARELLLAADIMREGIAL